MSQKRVPLPMFRSIVVATDLSARSREVFRVACSVADEEATRVILLNVEEPVPIVETVGFGEVGVPLYPLTNEPSEREARVRQLRERFVPGIPLDLDYQVRSGKPAEEILKASEEASSDLVVLGTHGWTGLDRLLLGSVAEVVMRRAHCACLTVKLPAAEDSAVEQGTRPIRTILHPTDFSPHSGAALRVARCLARNHGARLILLHVVPIERVAGIVPEPMLDLELGREALAETEWQIDGDDLKSPVESQLKRGDAAAEVLDSAAALGCDLIVMGSHGRSGLGRLLFGSVAERVMRGATCPVLTVKEHIRAPLGEVAASAPLHK